MNVLHQDFRKLASDKQTRLTDTTEIIYHTASRGGVNNFLLELSFYRSLVRNCEIVKQADESSAPAYVRRYFLLHGAAAQYSTRARVAPSIGGAAASEVVAIWTRRLG